MVKRKENREARFAEVVAKGGEKFKNTSIDSVSVRDLFELNESNSGFLSRTFAYKINQADNSQEPYDVAKASQ